MNAPFKVGTAIPQLATGDINITEEFFQQKLGFKTAAKFLEHRFLIMKREDAEIHFWQAATADEAKSIGRNSSCYIRVENVRTLFDEFKSRQTPFRYELTEQPWGMNEMQIDDPYLNAIRFGEPLR